MLKLERLQILAGPIATAAIATGFLLASRYVSELPAPVAITAIAVFLSTCMGGLASGFVSYAILLGFAIALLSGPQQFFSFTADNAARLLAYALLVPPSIGLVAWSRRRVMHKLAEERSLRERIEASNLELESLRAALNEIHVGVLLLDENLRLKFMNKAMRDVGAVPQALSDKQPPIRELLEFGCETGVFPVAPERRGDYVKERVAEIVRADPFARELRLGSGEVALAQCAALPHGGRVVIYSIVTDLVRQKEELANLRNALNQIDYGIVLLNRDLRAEFANKAISDLGGVPPWSPNHKPYFGDVLRQVAANDGYAISAERREQMVRERLDWVTSVNPAPFEMKAAKGRIIRVKCIVLPDGARMLTYTDETEITHHVDELEELASVDGLTQLYNRRHFQTLIDTEWQRFRRTGRVLSLLMLDIDRFKSVNDRFGHDAGDQVLKQVAGRCLTARRSADIVCRYGGEEFGVILPQTDLPSAMAAAERLRVAIAERPFIIEGGTLKITASIGVATANSDTVSTEDLVKRADRALYAAKRNGRDRIAGDSDGSNAATAASAA